MTSHPLLRRARGGQSLVEFALVLPILLLLIFSIFDFGYYFFTVISVGNATRSAVRVGSLNNISQGQMKTLVVQNAVGTLVATSNVNITKNNADTSFPGNPPTLLIETSFQHRFWALGFVGLNTLPIKSSFRSIVVTSPTTPTISF